MPPKKTQKKSDEEKESATARRLSERARIRELRTLGLPSTATERDVRAARKSRVEAAQARNIPILPPPGMGGAGGGGGDGLPPPGYQWLGEEGVDDGGAALLGVVGDMEALAEQRDISEYFTLQFNNMYTQAKQASPIISELYNTFRRKNVNDAARTMMHSAGLRKNKDAPLTKSELKIAQSLSIFKNRQKDTRTYNEQVRAFRRQYILKLKELGRSGSRAQLVDSRVIEHGGNSFVVDELAFVGAYDEMQQRMSKLRKIRLSNARQIPFFTVNITMRPNDTFKYGAIADKTSLLALKLAEYMKLMMTQYMGPSVNVIPNQHDLMSITIGNLRATRPDMTTFDLSMTTPALHIITMTTRQIQTVIMNELDSLLQSGTGFNFDAPLYVSMNAMFAPRAGTWSPRTDIESFFVKSTIRYIPPETYIDNICLPIAILTSACRVMNDQGLYDELEYEEMMLGDDNAEFQLFDTREMTNPDYYNTEEKIEELCDAAYALMEEAFVEYEDLGVESCVEFARILNIQIHVLYQESMCKRLAKFGDANCKRHVTILIREDHAFPVMKPWRLTSNCMPGQWCDICHDTKSRAWSVQKMAHHRLTCDGEIKKYEDEKNRHGKEFIQKRYSSLYNHRENDVLKAPYCRTCEKFCIEHRVALLSPDHQMESSGDQLQACIESGHNVVDNVEMGKCTTCDCYLPIGWPNIRDRPLNKLHYVNEHRCYISNPELKIGDSSKYYVWDIETLLLEGVHVPIYIYVRSLYNAGETYEFEDIERFCSKIISSEFKDTTWIAHNSGGFDSNFVHSWLEKNGVMHSRIPSPTSINRSLDTTIDAFNIRFIDSYNFIPMALAKIGPAFNLPDVKGDFPHKFSKLQHLSYEGPMPACDTDEDWYDLQGKRSSSIEKSEVLIHKFKVWHAEESRKYFPHTTKLWSYEEQLRAYCKLDCDVLAGALRILRDSFMEVDKSQVSGVGYNRFCLCPVDPLCYLTMAQVCQKLYIAGLYESGNQLRIAHIPLPDRIQHVNKTRWLMDEEMRIGTRMYTANNYLHEWIADDGLPVDGYAEIRGERHVWEYIDCMEKGCSSCTVASQKNVKYGCTNKEMYDKITARNFILVKLGYRYHCRFSHEDRHFDPSLLKIPRFDSMAAQRQRSDGGFFGGRVEVFKPMWNAREDEKIQYIDVVSLYPWVCATQRMCVGYPTIYMSDRIDRSRMLKSHARPYFGYAHVHVKGCKDDYFGGLPRRDSSTDRLIFDNTEYTVICFIDELHERMENGLVLLDVYEVWDWSAEGVSVEGPMSGYVSYFLRDKMECSGWRALCGKEPETEEEKVAICDHLEKENLGLCRPRPDKVADNPGGRQLAKLRLNMLWGKFVQTPRITTSKFISSYGDYVQLWYDNQVDKSTLKFRRVHEDLDFMEVRYGYNSSAKAPGNTHYYLGASCTAQARLKLTSMLRQVGKDRALYCDTDSVVYVHREGDEEIETGEALGQWSSELDDGVWGEKFMALAPKCYMIMYNEEGKIKEKESAILKTKGVTLTTTNLRELNCKNMEKIILTEVFGDYTGEDKEFKVQAKTFNIRMNLEGDREMMNMHGEKVVQCVYTKRNVIVPDGADPHHLHFLDTNPFY